MKKALLIIFLAALSLGACVLLYFIYHLSFGLIVLRVGESAAMELAQSISIQLLSCTLGVLVILSLLSFFVLKKGLRTKRSSIVAIGLAILVLGISFPSFLNARDGFLAYQLKPETLEDFHSLDEVESIEVQLSSKDSTIFGNDKDLLEDLKKSKYKRGVWKYIKTHRIIIQHSDHVDTLYTNGQLIGPMENRYFETNEDMKDKYGW